MNKIKKKRGFSALSPERRKEISTLGGKSVDGSKRAFSVNKELAKKAGSKGGMNVAANKRSFFTNSELAVTAGQLGGVARRRKAKNKNQGH